jgi:hypothetical protein
MRALMAFIMVAGLAVQGLEGADPGSSGMPPAEQEQSTVAAPSLAEQYLFRLSNKLKKRRTTGGAISLAAGAVLMAGGLAMLSQDEEDDFLALGELFGAMFIVEGGVGLVAGTVLLAFPSRAEKADARIRAVSDAVERERAAEEALGDLAKKGRRARMIQGGIGVAAGIAVIFAGGDADASGKLLSGASIGALAAYSFLAKSPEEKAYRSYQERRGLKPSPDLILGLTPHGGVLAGLSLSF